MRTRKNLSQGLAYRVGEWSKVFESKQEREGLKWGHHTRILSLCLSSGATSLMETWGALVHLHDWQIQGTNERQWTEFRAIQKGLGFKGLTYKPFVFFSNKTPITKLYHVKRKRAGLQLPKTNWMTKSYYNIIQWKNKPIYIIPWHHHPMKEWTELQNPITSSSNERTNPFT
jgi:hypothetical protein